MQAVLPQYQFQQLLGRGGMGAVYKALQVNLQRPVAIKVLPADLGGQTDAHFAERFKHEALTMAKLSHPCIVEVHDFGQTNNGLLYIVMHHVDGTDVAQMIAAQGRLPESNALSIAAHVCDALAYAHKHGVVHRDIKPANILIDREGGVKVADFGLAKVNDAGLGAFTKTNVVMGTPDFLAPEALIPGVPLDGRADLYSLGVTLYQMLTGEIPRGVWNPPGNKIGTDPRFDSIITRALQSDRALRYQNAGEMRQDFDSIISLPREELIARQQAAAEASAAATRSQRKSPASGQRKTKAREDSAGKPTTRLQKQAGSTAALRRSSAPHSTTGMRRAAGTTTRKRSVSGANTRARKKGRKRRIAAAVVALAALVSAIIGYFTGSGLRRAETPAPLAPAAAPAVPSGSAATR
jgi:serine/threonine protein kinase